MVDVMALKAAIPKRPTIVGRLAPSPTGRLHLGHAWSFLLAWWHIRSRGGRIMLRIEDLDAERAKNEFIDAAIEDLRWLGLDWDGEPYVQSSGITDIAAASQKLLEIGLAYPCVCTRKEIQAAASAPQGNEQTAPYPGTCRGKFETLAAAERSTGRPAALRFRVPDQKIHIEDGILGDYEINPTTAFGDFPIMRHHGLPAYQLAVVVDDARHGVTEVMRGADLLESAARQWLLQEALDYDHPSWWHVPLVCDENGRRLAKRSDDLSIARLRNAGIDPRRVVAWVAHQAGMEVPSQIDAREVLCTFEIARLPRNEIRITRPELAALGMTAGV